MSLYPFVCKYFKFPVGHPVIQVGDACRDMESMLQKDGLVKYCILTPRTLYHIVLPFRCKGKLLYCLWKTCATEGNTGICSHEAVADRDLTAKWVIDEIRLAVGRGKDW